MDSSKKIKFSVPANWQDNLIPGLPKDEVAGLYGKLAVDFMGGGRASSILYPVSKEKAALYIATAHKRGFGFNYLLNSTCMDNRELTKYGQGKIIELLDWIVKVGIDSVTVSAPFVLRLIKEKFPSLKVNISVHVNINSVKEAKLWDELGADKITLSVLDVNRDFSLLKEIRAAVGCQLQLIANLKCLLGCPFYKYHANLTSHASQSEHLLKGYVIDYCTVRCNFIRISRPMEYIKSSWIRPEDVHHYERLGIDSLKLVGRQMQTEFIHRIVNAYARRRYDGNLLDLLPTHQKGLVIGKKKFFSYIHKLKFFFRPQYVNVFKLQKARQLFREEEMYIDNRALDGFLNYFLAGKCNFACEPACTYCDDIARKVLRVNSAYRDRVQSLTGNFLNELYNGRMFRYPGLARK